MSQQQQQARQAPPPQQVPARRPLPALPERHGQPITHALRGYGRQLQDQGDIYVEVDIDERDLLAQAEIIASFESLARARRGGLK